MLMAFADVDYPHVGRGRSEHRHPGNFFAMAGLSVYAVLLLAGR
jgi:hypothetical protein